MSCLINTVNYSTTTKLEPRLDHAKAPIASLLDHDGSGQHDQAGHKEEGQQPHPKVLNSWG